MYEYTIALVNSNIQNSKGKKYIFVLSFKNKFRLFMYTNEHYTITFEVSYQSSLYLAIQ